ncbi:MAG: AI-2E family transporter [Deltaproteobacteria bacterium]|nr:MAG: AI-2E family transporter [Deltaproteobacteria bacterium]
MELIRAWFSRTFSNPQVVILILLLVGGFAIVALFGEILAPVLVALVLAYLLEGVVQLLMKRLGRRRLPAVVVVYTLFVLCAVGVLIGPVPLLVRQVGELATELPQVLSRLQAALETLPGRYPELVSEQQIQELLAAATAEATRMGKELLGYTVASVVGVVTAVVYAFLTLLLLFFMLKDKEVILGWLARFVPKQRELAVRVWREVDHQIGNYIRGKFVEILIVWAASWLAFALLGLNFAALLGLFVGLSVLVPYIGAAFMTLPVGLVAFAQWGAAPEVLWVLLAYLVIQALDGNLLVPLLFSEAVHLHPVAIIVAVLLFGGLWGFWGVFFAIPLATLVRAVLAAWPQAVAAESRDDTAPCKAPEGAAGAASAPVGGTPSGASTGGAAEPAVGAESPAPHSAD